jgi:co-chaperonin GroES (HSP10)
VEEYLADSKEPRIRPTPGRVVVRFAPPKAQSGLIFLPGVARRAEKYRAELYEVGTPTDRSEELFVEEFRKGDTIIANRNLGTPVPGHCDEGNENVTDFRYYIFRMFEVAGGTDADAGDVREAA